MISYAKKLVAFLALLTFQGLMQSAQAGVIYNTPVGSSTGGGSVSAKADITTGNGSITVILSNLTQNSGNAAQLLSAILFDVSGLSGSGNLSTVGSGLVTTITSGGAYTAGVADPLTRWEASYVGSSITTLTTLSGGNPDRLIIGPDSLGNLNPALGGLYSAANASVIGDNPSVLGTATFTITAPGVTAASTLSNVIFQFGTTAGQNQVTGVVGPPSTPVTTSATAPEPSTLAIFGLGIVMFLGRARRNRKVLVA